MPSLGIAPHPGGDRKSTRLNSSHDQISYAVFCLKKKRFVQQNVNPPPLLRFHDSPGRLNPVLSRVRLCPQFLYHVPVHTHLSAQDQQFRMPPRSNPRPRNNLLQSFFFYFSGPPRVFLLSPSRRSAV